MMIIPFVITHVSAVIFIINKYLIANLTRFSNLRDLRRQLIPAETAFYSIFLNHSSRVPLFENWLWKSLGRSQLKLKISPEHFYQYPISKKRAGQRNKTNRGPPSLERDSIKHLNANWPEHNIYKHYNIQKYFNTILPLSPLDRPGRSSRERNAFRMHARLQPDRS